MPYPHRTRLPRVRRPRGQRPRAHPSRPRWLALVALAALLAAADEASGSGIAIVLGDPAAARDLASGGRWAVLAVAADEAGRAAAADLLARADSPAGAIALGSLPRLPCADRIANLVVCDADALAAAAPGDDELRRIVVPGGELRLRRGGAWRSWRAPPPAGAAWPSFDGGRGAPASSDDPQLTLPLAVRWLDGPLIGQTPAGIDVYCNVVDGGGFFQVTNLDEANVHLPAGRRPLWIVARDACNGSRWWRRPYPGPIAKEQRWGGLIAASPSRIYAWAAEDAILACDPRTGADLQRIAVPAGRRAPGHLLWQGGKLLAQTAGGWSAFAGDGAPAWSIATADAIPFGRSGINHLADDRTLLVQEPGRLRAFDLADGRERWAIAMPEPGPRQARTWEMQSMSGGAVTVRTAGGLTGYALADGRRLWSEAVQKAVPFNGRPDALAWRDGFAFLGRWRDAATGADRGPAPAAAVDRCTPPFLAAGFHISSHGSAIGLADPAQRPPAYPVLTAGAKERSPSYAALRLACNTPNAAAYGLIFAQASDCTCNAGHLRGIAAHGAAPAHLAAVDPAAPLPTVRGPGRPAATAPDAGGWPMFRANPQRSAGVAAPGPRAPARRWTAQLGGPLPEGPVAEARAAAGFAGVRGLAAAEGLVCVADAGRQRVVALDAGDGRRRWTVQLGAGIDAAPTIHAGRVLFGSHDGWVWCVSSADGALIWRTRLAPAEDLVPAYGSLASRWPVVGAVTVDGDAVLASAGRSSLADGGLLLAGLDLATGAVRWQRRVGRSPVRDVRFFNDAIIAGPRGLRLLGQPATAAAPRDEGKLAPPSDALVPAIEGLVGYVRNDQDAAPHGYAWAPMLYGGIRGRMLAWRDGRVFGIARHTYAWVNESTTDLKQPVAWFMAMAQTDRPAPPSLDLKNPVREYGPPTAWSLPLPDTAARIRACIVAGDVGWGAWAAPRPSGPPAGRIAAMGLDDGRPGPQIELDAAPVRDGLIATAGRLYVACADGAVIAFHDP